MKRLIWVFISIICFTCCSKEDDLYEGIIPENKEYAKAPVPDSLMLEMDNHQAFLVYQYPGDKIYQIIYNIAIFDYDNNCIYRNVESRQNEGYIVKFTFPEDIAERFNNGQRYIVNISTDKIMYDIPDEKGNMYADNFIVADVFKFGEAPIEEEIYPTDPVVPEVKYGTFFNINQTYITPHKNGYSTHDVVDNSIIYLWCNNNEFEIGYNTDYENSMIKIYYDDTEYTNKNGIIHIYTGYNLTDTNKSHTITINYTDSVEHMITLNIIQYKFQSDLFFLGAFSLQYTGGSSVSIPGYFCSQESYALVNNSGVDVRPIQCDIYINNVLAEQITFNETDILRANSRMDVYRYTTYNRQAANPSVGFKLTFEFNGTIYTTN